MGRRNRRDMVHEACRFAPSSLIKITSRPCIMARVRDVPATGIAADMRRLIAGRYNVRDKALELLDDPRIDRDGDISGGLYSHHSRRCWRAYMTFKNHPTRMLNVMVPMMMVSFGAGQAKAEKTNDDQEQFHYYVSFSE